MVSLACMIRPAWIQPMPWMRTGIPWARGSPAEAKRPAAMAAQGAQVATCLRPLSRLCPIILAAMLAVSEEVAQFQEPIPILRRREAFFEGAARQPGGPSGPEVVVRDLAAHAHMPGEDLGEIQRPLQVIAVHVVGPVERGDRGAGSGRRPVDPGALGDRGELAHLAVVGDQLGPV